MSFLIKSPRMQACPLVVTQKQIAGTQFLKFKGTLSARNGLYMRVIHTLIVPKDVRGLKGLKVPDHSMRPFELHKGLHSVTA